MKKILLLNPPSGRFKFSRDYFCSKVLKGGYVEHPVDILILAGLLYGKFEVKIIDAVVEGLNPFQVLHEIRFFSPDTIIFLAGSASLDKDFSFMEQVKKENKNVSLIGLGDIFFLSGIVKDLTWLDGVLFDFTTTDILHYLYGDFAKVKNMVFRQNGNIVTKELVKYEGEEFEVPIPRHELFLKKTYTFPFAKSLPFATLLTDFGCPFNCSFCIYSHLGYKVRKLENIFEELEYLAKLGINEIFIKDQTFGYDKKRTELFCQEILHKQFHFSWTGFSRADIINDEMLKMMKDAGCHTLIIGVETANEDLLRSEKGGLTKGAIELAFQRCRKVGIRTVGTFMLGFPQESKEGMLRTVSFARSVGCDFASFNMFVPKVHTKYEENTYNRKMIDRAWDQSGIYIVSGSKTATARQISFLISFAALRFYIRPKFLREQLRNISSFCELRMLVKNGLMVFRNYIVMFIQQYLSI